MAFRLLQRASQGGSSAPSAAATAAAAGVASLGLTPLSTAHSDAAPSASRGVSVVQLGSSWEDLLSSEHVETMKTSSESSSRNKDAATTLPPPLSADAPKAVAGREGAKNAADTGIAQASEAKTGASSGESPVFTTFSLAPPTRDETEAAISDVEALLNKGVPSFLASSNSSWCEASATMEASERAIQRAQCLLAEDSSVDSGSYYNVSAPDTILPAASPSASAPAVGAAASPAPAAAAAVGPLSLRMPQPLNAASGIAGAPSAALSSSSFGTSSQMAVFMSNHREDVENILQDPKLWSVLMMNEHVREIMRKEGAANVDSSPPATPKSEADSWPKGAPQTGRAGGFGSNGMWEFLAMVHAKLETLVTNVKTLLFAEQHEVKGAGEQGSGKAGGGFAKQYGEGAPPSAWGVFGGILAVVVAVAFLVLLRRSKRGL